MKTMYCVSYVGGCLIGNTDWTFVVPNIGGDGDTKVVVFDEFDSEKFREYESENELNFVSSVYGKFNIYDHDCAFNGYGGDVIETLDGRYVVYNGKMQVVFERLA